MEYRVELNAFAHVRQVHYIEAETEADAFIQALEDSGNVIWEYRGVESDSIVADISAERETA